MRTEAAVITPDRHNVSSFMSRRRRATRLGVCGAAALIAVCGAAGPAPAQPEPRAASAPSAMDPDSITGRDFAGIRLAAAPQAGDLVLRAQRVWRWTEEASLDPADDTHRLYLQGDVQVDFGVYRFSAVQATVWIESVGTTPEGKEQRQIAVYFDRVSDPGAQAGFAMAGDRLLVTGVLEGEVRVVPDSMRVGEPQEPFVRASHERLARLLRELVSGSAGDAGVAESPQPGETDPRRRSGAPVAPGMSRPYEPGSPLGPDRAPLVTEDYRVLPPAERRPAIFAKKGVLTFALGVGETFTVLPNVEGEERVAVASGGVVVVYNDRATGDSVQISAERMVVFLQPGTIQDLLQSGRAPVENVRGIYLEGGVMADVVATDGQYTLRGPKVYYDVQNNKAIMLDAVFHTFDEKRGLPLYLRASAVRQEAKNQFSAKKATLATSSFFEPHLSIGVNSLTVTQAKVPARPTLEELLFGDPDEAPREREALLVDARGVTLRAGGTPFFWFPGFKGDPSEIPLRGIRVENSTGDGVSIKTSWDMFSLLRIERPEELNWHVMADGYIERGAAVGTLVDWRTDDSAGFVRGYMIINDEGTDHLSSGARVEQDGDNRGSITGEHVWDIDSTWRLFIEGAYFSDETYVDAFERAQAQSAREFKNNIFLQGTDANTVLTLEAGIEANDFTPNQYLLQSLGYNTIKQPELRYARINDDLLSGEYPGLLSWTQEWRAGRMYLNFTEPTARELGFTNASRSMEAFGILPDESLGDQLRARGLTESEVMRADTRHEFSSQFDLGPVNLTPFVVGRATVYSRDFDEYSPDAEDSLRLFGAAGVRAATTIQRVDNSVDNRFFDLHRVRHIIEPNITAWTSASNLDQNDLPIYDDHVESLADGSAVKFGLMQTWQTQRGGPGRMRSVDFLKVNLEYVNSSSDADRESPIPRFFDAFPEYSLLGDFAMADIVWQATDAVAISFNEIYDFETNQSARTSVGGVVQHSENFRSYAELRFINARDITLFDFGAEYKLTEKYRVTGSVTYDTDEGDIQTISGSLHRRFPNYTLGVRGAYNNISGDTSFSVVFEPAGRQETRTSGLRRRLRAEDFNLLEGNRWGPGLE